MECGTRPRSRAESTPDLAEGKVLFRFSGERAPESEEVSEEASFLGYGENTGVPDGFKFVEVPKSRDGHKEAGRVEKDRERESECGL